MSTVGTARPHESAHLHVAGAAPYIDDIAEVAGTLHAALGLSPVAHGRLLALDLDSVRAMPGVVTVLSAADIPGTNDCGPIVHDDPILAQDTVTWRGQPMFAVIARSRGEARRAAALAAQVATIEPLPAVLDPLEGPRAATVRRAADAPRPRRRASRHRQRAAPVRRPLQPRWAGAVLPGRPDRLRHPAGKRWPARP